MNRIILIGNGFDLAHGLPTSYADFLDYYWEQRMDELARCPKEIHTDGLSLLRLEQRDLASEYGSTWNQFMWQYANSFTEPITKKEWIKLIKEDPNNFSLELTPFFRAINYAYETKKWVDIENEYYLMLKKIVKKVPCGYDSPRQLDEEMKIVTEKLKAYLSDIQAKYIPEGKLNQCISPTIYSPFKVNDIAIEGKKLFDQFLVSRANFLAGSQKEEIDRFLSRFGCAIRYTGMEIPPYIQSLEPDNYNGLDSSKHLAAVYDKSTSVPDCFLWPDQVLLLTFNYTKTADLYVPEDSGFKVIHIHGELGNEKNPIIFGYGDELDEDYKTISNLNDNAYLGHIKSYRYLVTDNYRRLLTFTDSAPYQIYIMGHSCGNSDRTLLNKLFEHRNCISIKPFYHLKEDGTDNYIDMVQNISRSFNDKQSMRDRVVNKSYCEPLVTA